MEVVVAPVQTGASAPVARDDARRPQRRERAKALGHSAALEGLRGLLVLVVLSNHLYPWPGMVGGQVAMDVFFALSGFLITGLLLGEKAHRSSVSIRSFYARRALRLLPGLCLFLVVWLLVVAIFGSFPWISSVPGSSNGGPVAFGTALQGVSVGLAYLSNWWNSFHLFNGYVPLGHLWSLAVEEQFYLLWAPLLAVLLLFRRRVTLAVTAALALLSLVEPLLLWDGGAGTARIVFGSDTRAATLLLGCAAAMLWSRGLIDWLRSRGLGILVALSVTALLVSGFGMANTGSEWQWYAGWVGAALGSAVLVLTLVLRPRGLASRLLGTPLLTYLGRRSYGLYLWHYVWATWTANLGTARYPLVVLMSLVSAEISWRLVEKRALHLKRRFALPQPVAQGPSRPGPICALPGADGADGPSFPGATHEARADVSRVRGVGLAAVGDSMDRPR